MVYLCNIEQYYPHVKASGPINLDLDQKKQLHSQHYLQYFSLNFLLNKQSFQFYVVFKKTQSTTEIPNFIMEQIRAI